MPILREPKKPLFALDELRPWLNAGPAAAGRAPKKTAGARWICELGLPPNNKRKKARDFAVFLLCAGAEIEHSLLTQYLYAAYSIDVRTAAIENTLALQWKTDIRLVAREEMAHLMTVQNLLLTLGADIHLNRSSLHRAPNQLALPYKLQALTKESLRKYVLFESPTPDQVDPGEPLEVDQIRAKVPRSAGLRRVGSIYAAIYWLFMESDKPDGDWPFAQNAVSCFTDEYGEDFHLKDSDFVRAEEYREKAADPKEWGIFESGTHVDGASPRETVLASLRWLMAQGEGPNAIEKSHFHRFLEIYREFNKPHAKAPSTIFHVPENPRVRGAKGSGGRGRQVGTLIKNKRSSWWGEVFNARYQLMLLNILESLGASRSKNGTRRKTLARWALVEMEFVKQIGQLLPYMFLDRTKAKRAAAPFQAIAFPASPVGQQKLRRDLVNGSASCIAKLADKSVKMAKYTDDEPTKALEASLVDAIARQNDEMGKEL